MDKKWLYFLGSILFAILLIGGWWFTRQEEGTTSVFQNNPLVLEEKSKSNSLEEVLVAANQSAGAEHSSLVTEASLSENSPIKVEVNDREEVSPSDPASLSPSPAPSLSIESRLIGFGHRTPPSPRTLDTIVLHSSYNASGGDAYDREKIIGQYEQYGVGAHYLIERNGRILRLVEEGDIAYHAGESKMPDGRRNVNDFSIGIELVATEESGYTDKQYQAVNDLIADIKTRHPIKDIVGHGDVAPKRKSDPWKFDWKRLK